jgi:hypothetical protein
MSFTRIEFGPLAAQPPASSPSSPPSLVSTGLQVGQTPAPAASPADPLAGTAASQVQVRTSPKGAFVNLAGGAPIERGTTSINMGNLPNGEAGILATANRQGTPKAAAELRPDDRISIAGLETSVENATRLGYLTRNPAGGYSDNSANLAAAEAAQTAAEEQARQEAAADPYHGQPLPVAGANEALGELVRSTTAGSQVRALLSLIDDGEVSRNSLASLASEMGNGVEPEAVAEKLGPVIEGFRQQVATLAASHGADATDFADWARAHHGTQFKEAMRQHGMSRTTAGYVPLLRAYMEALPSRPGGAEAILNAKFPNEGVSAYKNHNGEIVLQTPNGEVSWRVAVRTGLVKPHRG